MKKRISCFALICLIILFSVCIPFSVNADSNGNTIVYITRTGDCYHRENCSYLQSKIEITLEKAVENNYSRCSRCKPPILGEPSATDSDPYVPRSSSSTSSSSNSSSSKSSHKSNDYELNESSASHSSNNAWIPIAIGCAGLGIGGYFVKSSLDEKKRKQIAAEEFEKEKQNFIAYLDGRDLETAAGVPSAITFINGYPRDNNNSMYGTYTVYLSQNGKCYHKTPGCCSARIAEHAFKASYRYRPCSKCCSNAVEIPPWFEKYKQLQRECIKYDLHL